MGRLGAAAAMLLLASPAAATQHLSSALLLPITRLAAGPVTTGDFNGDGHRDVAYGLHNPTGVAVLLGDGQGRFSEPIVSQIASATSSSSEAIVADDWNGDGRLDLALSDFATGPAVYLGLGDGRFAGSSLGGEPLSLGLAAGDFDGDGRRDLALARRGFTSVAQVLFYRGNGAGAFAAPITWNLPTLLLPHGVVARDFDGDGHDDLAVADNFGNSVAILIGSPTLAPDVRGPFPAGEGPQGIDAGDLDGDGRLDVVTADQRGRTVSLLLGDGAGSLGAPLVRPGPVDAREVLLGHFDADNRLDVAVSGAGLWIHAGDGAGGLGPPRRYGVSGDVASAELTGDGRLDLVTGVSLLPGDGAGGFAAQRTFPIPPDARTGLAADFDRDGHADVAVVHGGGTLSILRGDGQGGLGAPVSTLTGTDPVDLVTADFDRDGWPDLAVAHAGTLDVVVLTNDRAGGFTRRSYAVGGEPQSLVTGDFGGDGLIDIAVANDTAGAIVVLHGLADGTFAFGGTTLLGTGSLALAAGHFNADARLDLAWFRAPLNTNLHVSILAGNGAEAFVPGPPLSLYTTEHALVAADVDSDGRLDLVGGGDHQPFPQVSGLGVRLGDGQGGFGPPVAQPPVQVQSLAVRDFTQDGRPDVAVFESSSVATGVRLLEGGGDGSFGLFEAAPIPVGGPGRSLIASDWNNDGRPDVAALVTPGDTLTILLGRDASSGTDLAIDVLGEPDPVAAGQAVRYVATAVNRGPLAAHGVRIRFQVPLGISYQGHSPGLPACVETSGLVTCNLNALAPGGAFVLTVDALTAPGSGGQPLGWAEVRGLGPEETAPLDNFTTFRTGISPVDLAISLTDTPDPVRPGQAFRYTMTVANQGAFTATRVFASAELPAGVTLVGLPDPACGSPNDVRVICGINSMFPGQVTSFAVDVQATTFTFVSLSATVESDQADVDPTDNVDVEETAMQLGLRGELGHGTAQRLALPAIDPAAERFFVRVPAHSSFEVLLDEASGDAAKVGLPIRLERLGADASSVLQVGAPAGAGPARVLRWQNTTGDPAVQLVRVRSQGCSTDCGPDDTYRVRAYDTTASFARFNTTGDQEAVVLVQNPSPSGTVSGTLWFWGPNGALLAPRPFVLPPRRSLVLNVATLLPGRSGSITLTHDGGYCGLLGKAVAIEPATGFSYDTPLACRPR